MRWYCVLAVFPVLSLAAQDRGGSGRYNGNFHGFAVMGACQHGYGLFGGGGGAEALLWKGISAGVDVSYQSFTDGNGFGMLTPQFGYHFTNRTKPLRWDPFVTVGAGIGWLSGGSAATGNLGGGFNYWFRPRMAIRVEFRVHGISSEGLATGRIGFSFR